MANHTTYKNKTFRPFGSALLIIVMLASLIFIGCGSSVDESDLRRWTKNAAGLDQVERKVMRNPSVSPAKRLQALEIMVEKGLTFELPRMVDAAPDGIEIAKRLIEKIRPRLKGASDEAAVTRDTLVQLVSIRKGRGFFLPPDLRSSIQKEIATWAFAGLDQNSTQKQIQTQIERRIKKSQISELGIHGVDGAGLLIQHGFDLKLMKTYLIRIALSSDSDIDEKSKAHAKAVLGNSLVSLHLKQKGDWPWNEEELRLMEASGAGRGFVPMMKIYLDPDKDPSLRLHALNAATSCASSALTDRKLVEDALIALNPILTGDSIDDRWTAIRMLVNNMGDAGFDLALEALGPDINFADAEERSTDMTMVEFCADNLHNKAKDSKDKVLKLISSRVPVQMALGIVCSKVWNSTSATRSLKNVVRKGRRRSLATVFDKVSNASALAQNALDGMELLALIDQQKKSKKITPERAAECEIRVKEILTQTGDAYRQTIQACLRAKGPGSTKTKDEGRN
ncbi:MAG: hypothetical protein CMH54_11860 [Myxococcales bacterium]|nr:hypothetical protein [Myxococcales bacterium]